MVNSRFAVAIHILSLIATTSDKALLTSDFIAGSVNTNPVVVRRISSLLKKVGLISSRKGISGYELTKKPEDISLYDIYRAVEEPKELFAIHQAPNPDCSVGRQIGTTLTDVFGSVQQAMENELRSQTLQSILDRLK